jgi:hypothetical protein
MPIIKISSIVYLFFYSQLLYPEKSTAVNYDLKTQAILKNNTPELVLLKSYPKPVITNRMPEAGSNKFGFEGEG